MELNQVIDIAIPSITILLMCIVGMELSISDFRRVIQLPIVIFTAILGQILILPLCGIALVLMISPSEGMIIGLILLTVCPGGALSNLYVYILSGNVALSVTLTAITTMLAVSYTPVLALWILTQLGYTTNTTEIPLWVISQQLFLYLLLPVLIGMFIRALSPSFVLKWRSLLQLTSIIGIAAIVAIIFAQHWKGLAGSLVAVAPIAVGFSLIAMMTGYLFSLITNSQYQERIAVMVEFGVRNIPIALIMASNFSGKSEAQLFAATYFVIHAPVILITGWIVKFVSDGMWTVQKED